MKGKNFLLLLLSLLAIFLTPSKCPAHGFAGKRFFPTTFQVDDPFISDEFLEVPFALDLNAGSFQGD